ncbi:hypothetical protein TNCV_3988531 [Trichonephila clavipes]|nr:hypothetical protein TNCV_3988531 [Trichonephila clavipes]
MATDSDDSSTFNFYDTNTEIHKVAVKPPAFWRNKLKLGFLQLEAQFSNSGISNDTTKYNIVVAALDENVLDFVVDILLNPPHDDEYETLKNAFLNRLTHTEKSHEIADKIIAVYSSSEVCSVTNNNSSSKSTNRNKLEALQADIEASTKKFDEFSRNSRQRSKSREYRAEALDPNLIHPDMHFVGIILSSEIMLRSVYNHANLTLQLDRTDFSALLERLRKWTARIFLPSSNVFKSGLAALF